jgi:hypothetical protein
MSIAELIMQGTNRASESTSWVGDSLAKLGQNVGAALAQREQQKQAQEMLPFLQQSMQESMELAGKGQTGDAYAKLMPFLTDPSVARNPFMMPALEAGIKMNQFATNDFLKKEQLRVREDMYNARYGGSGGGGGGGLPAGPSAFFGNAGTTPVGGDVTSNAKTSLTQDEQRPIIQAAQNVTNAVLLPDEVPQPDSSGFPAISTPDKWMEAQTPFEKQEGTLYQQASQNQGLIEPSTEVKKSFENNEKAYSNATPQQQQTFQNNLSSTTIPQGTNVTQFDFSNIKSLRNVVGIASPVEMQIEVPESLSITENDKGKSYLTKFNKKTTNQNVIDKSNELVLKSVPNALAGISSNETLSKYFEENDLGKLDIGAKKEGGELSYYIGVRGKKDSYIEITEPDYENAKMIRNLPASAKTLDSAFIITDKPLPKEEPAATEAPAPTQGGLPATQPPPAVAPEIPDVEGNPFTEKVKKIKTEETEKQKKLTTDEISRVVETTNRLQQALDGLAKGEYPKVMDYLPRTKKTTLESSSLDALKNEYNVLANLKPAIEWLKKNPNHKDAPAAAEVIKQKLGI